jgi:hypothetical protein
MSLSMGAIFMSKVDGTASLLFSYFECQLNCGISFLITEPIALLDSLRLKIISDQHPSLIQKD